MCIYHFNCTPILLPNVGGLYLKHNLIIKTLQTFSKSICVRIYDNPITQLKAKSITSVKRLSTVVLTA